MARHFLSQNDLTADEIHRVLQATSDLKDVRASTQMSGRTLVMFFEKTSTRTRLSFEIGMTQLGGHAVYLDRDSSQMARGESIEDTARVVSRYADLVMARVDKHLTVSRLAAASSIPVINGLSDLEHPCQSMADLFTIAECKASVRDVKIAYVGDGDNNVTHSLMLGAAKMGAHVAVAAPLALWPGRDYIQQAQADARTAGGSVAVSEHVEEVVRDADIVYTDVWVSMGREADRANRLAQLGPYQVNARLLDLARPDCVFMHCLPAHIGEEVTGDVAYGPHSVIFQQAENRLHVQKALILYLMEMSEGGQ